MKKLILILVSLFIFASACAEDYNDLYVTATKLNGRYKPSKRTAIEACFDYGDALKPTGNWSKDYKWVEVYGGESGSVWCSIQYVTEITEPKTYINPDRTKIKIRKSPVKGTVVAYLKYNRKVEITQVVQGWGKCNKGWIDLSYLEEYDDK